LWGYLVRDILITDWDIRNPVEGRPDEGRLFILPSFYREGIRIRPNESSRSSSESRGSNPYGALVRGPRNRDALIGKFNVQVAK